MKINKAGLILMIDAECEFGRIAFSPRDGFKHKFLMFVSALLGMDYSAKTLKQIINLLKKYNMPATLFFVGSLLIKNGNKKLLEEYSKGDIRTKYLWNKKRLMNIMPLLGDYIEKEVKNSVIEISFHNFIHESNFLEADENIERSIKFSKQAAKELGVKISTYAAPWFELENPENPSRIYRILKNNRIYATRFDGARSKYGKLKSKDRKGGFHNRHGIKCIYSSYFVGNGKVDLKEQKIIEEGIREAIKEKSIYALSFHDTTFLRHGLKHFEDIIKIIKKYEKELYIATLYDMSKLFGKQKNNLQTTRKKW